MRLFGKDITNLYAAPVSELAYDEYETDITVQMMSIDELLPFSENQRLDLTEKSVKILESSNKYCFGIFHKTQLVGYNFFAVGDVSPEFNTGGVPFSGIGLKLPAGVAYLFKSFVLPEYRGKHLLSLAIVDGSKETVGSGGWAITTTDVKNYSSNKMFVRIGFKRLCVLREYFIFNRSMYMIPKTVQLGESFKNRSKMTKPLLLKQSKSNIVELCAPQDP